MICLADALPSIFSGIEIPTGPISSEAAEVIARLLMDLLEGDKQDAREDA